MYFLCSGPHPGNYVILSSHISLSASLLWQFFRLCLFSMILIDLDRVMFGLCVYWPVYLHISINISKCNHLCLYKLKHKFISISLTLTTWIILPSFPGLLVNSQSNSEQPGFHNLPPIFFLIVQFQYMCIGVSELLIQIPVRKHLIN